MSILGPHRPWNVARWNGWKPCMHLPRPIGAVGTWRSSDIRSSVPATRGRTMGGRNRVPRRVGVGTPTRLRSIGRRPTSTTPTLDRPSSMWMVFGSSSAGRDPASDPAPARAQTHQDSPSSGPAEATTPKVRWCLCATSPAPPSAVAWTRSRRSSSSRPAAPSSIKFGLGGDGGKYIFEVGHPKVDATSGRYPEATEHSANFTFRK